MSYVQCVTLWKCVSSFWLELLEHGRKRPKCFVIRCMGWSDCDGRRIIRAFVYSSGFYHSLISPGSLCHHPAQDPHLHILVQMFSCVLSCCGFLSCHVPFFVHSVFCPATWASCFLGWLAGCWAYRLRSCLHTCCHSPRRLQHFNPTKICTCCWIITVVFHSSRHCHVFDLIIPCLDSILSCLLWFFFTFAWITTFVSLCVLELLPCLTVGLDLAWYC